MIRSVQLIPARRSPVPVPLEQVPDLIRRPDSLVWIDLSAPSQEEVYRVMRDLFHFHPLAIEDCLHRVNHTPKLDDFGSYLFVIAYAVKRDEPADPLEFPEVHLFIGHNFLVTHHHQREGSPVEKVWEHLSSDERLQQNGADLLGHAVLDALVDEYLPVVEQIDLEVEQLEELVFNQTAPWMMKRLLAIKHEMLALRRKISPMRDVISQLSRDPFPVIDHQSRIYFRDIYDHLRRIEEMSEQVREMTVSAQELYLSANSLRLNEVIKTLTIFSTIFLPLSFLASVYGMNFRNFPELDWRFGYPLAWLLFIAITAGMLYWFRRRKWF